MASARWLLRLPRRGLSTSARIATHSAAGAPFPLRAYRTISIFGATGFLGRYVVNALGRSGWQVHIAVRGDDMEWRHLKPLCDLGMLMPHYYNAKDQASVQAAIPEGTDVVLNLVGKRYETKHVLPWHINNTFEDTHVRAALAIAVAARKAHAKHLVHVSSARASLSAPSQWARTKAEGEAVVRMEFPGVCVVRPGVMYGEEDNFLNWYASRSWTPLELVDGEGATVSPVFVGDVGRALAQIAGDWHKYCDTTVDLLGKDAYTQKQIAEYVFGTIGKNKSIRVVDKNDSFKVSLAAAGARFLESLPNPVVTTDDLALSKCSDAPSKGALTFADVGVTPAAFESKAFNFLYRYQPGGHFRELRAIELKGQQHVSHLLHKDPKKIA